MLRLLIDTSVWLDVARSRNGQRVIVPLRVLQHQGEIELIVPEIVVTEFERNRPRAEDAVTAQVTERFRLLRRDVHEYAGDSAPEWLEEMAHQVPLLSAAAKRNFAEIAELLDRGRRIVETDETRRRAIQRGLDNRQPFGHKNSVADALLIEMFGDLRETSESGDDLIFATSNYQDFSAQNADRRQPHPDIAELFRGDSLHYCYGVEEMERIFTTLLGETWTLEVEEIELLHDEPRTLGEILEAEGERFDKIWYVRSLIHDEHVEDGSAKPPPEDIRERIEANRERVRQKYGPENVGPWDDWHWGYIHGELSALRWALGEDWGFLDT